MLACASRSACCCWLSTSAAAPSFWPMGASVLCRSFRLAAGLVAAWYTSLKGRPNGPPPVWAPLRKACWTSGLLTRLDRSLSDRPKGPPPDCRPTPSAVWAPWPSAPSTSCPLGGPSAADGPKASDSLLFWESSQSLTALLRSFVDWLPVLSTALSVLDACWPRPPRASPAPLSHDWMLEACGEPAATLELSADSGWSA